MPKRSQNNPRQRSKKPQDRNQRSPSPPEYANVIEPAHLMKSGKKSKSKISPPSRIKESNSKKESK